MTYLANGAAARPAPGIPEEFRCDVTPQRDVVSVQPVGDIDLATAPAVHAQLEDLVASGFRHVVLDLRRVTFLDSSAISLLLSWHKRAIAAGFELEIVEAPELVMRPLDLTGVREVLRG